MTETYITYNDYRELDERVKQLEEEKKELEWRVRMLEKPPDADDVMQIVQEGIAKNWGWISTTIVKAIEIEKRKKRMRRRWWGR